MLLLCLCVGVFVYICVRLCVCVYLFVGIGPWTLNLTYRLKGLALVHMSEFILARTGGYSSTWKA